MVGEGGMPIGLLPDIEFESFEFDLQPDDQLVLYSDGLTEAENLNGEQLEEDGLAEIIRKCSSKKGSLLLESIHQELTTFCGTSEFSDDVSALIFERTQRS